jgi:hypothetical protein
LPPHLSHNAGANGDHAISKVRQAKGVTDELGRKSLLSVLTHHPGLKHREDQGRCKSWHPKSVCGSDEQTLLETEIIALGLQCKRQAQGRRPTHTSGHTTDKQDPEIVVKLGDA